MLAFRLVMKGMGEPGWAWDNTSNLEVKGAVEARCLRPGRGDRHDRLRIVLDLKPVEHRIAAAFAYEFVMAAGFDDRAAFDHEDAVGMGDRVQAVGDGDGGAALA